MKLGQMILMCCMQFICMFLHHLLWRLSIGIESTELFHLKVTPLRVKKQYSDSISWIRNGAVKPKRA